jgi:hypothetical protein
LTILTIRCQIKDYEVIKYHKNVKFKISDVLAMLSIRET